MQTTATQDFNMMCDLFEMEQGVRFEDSEGGESIPGLAKRLMLSVGARTIGEADLHPLEWAKAMRAAKALPTLPGSGPVNCECGQHRSRCTFGLPHHWGKAFVDPRTGVPLPKPVFWCPRCDAFCTDEEF